MKKITVVKFIDRHGKEKTGASTGASTEINLRGISKIYQGAGQPAPF
jgi:hypothetical protein